jgi:hypothetical protein
MNVMGVYSSSRNRLGDGHSRLPIVSRQEREAVVLSRPAISYFTMTILHERGPRVYRREPTVNDFF